MRYNSTTENNWVKIIEIPMTEEQKSIINLGTEESNNLIAELQSNSILEVNDDDKIRLVDFYNSIKPELGINDDYQLISINIFEIKGAFKGILNYRINNEHKQIRF